MKHKSDIIAYFKSLTSSQILALMPGKWGDYELLDVLHYFDEENLEDQSAALAELILRSPENSDMVLYSDIYSDLAQYHKAKDDYTAALRWLYASFAYDEQHDPDLNRHNRYRDLAETYLDAGEVDTGLSIVTRRLQAAPDDIWTINMLAFTLPYIGLNDLAIETLERGLALTETADLENIRDELEEMYQEAIERKEKDTKTWIGEIHPAVLNQFRTALQLPVPPGDGKDLPEPYLPPLDRLLTAGPEPDVSLYAEIMAQGQVLAPDLIRMAFDETLWDTAVPSHAISLLRQLQTQMPELAQLALWLERAEGNWPVDLLTKRIGKVGGYTTLELEAIAADTDYHLYIRSAATDALAERAQKLPDQRERITSLFRALLTRPQAHEAAEETFIGFLIGDIVDMGARELYDEVKRAYDEDRVDLTILDFPYIHEKWGLEPLPQPEIRSDGLYLMLRCTHCHRERIHFVQHVIVDLNTLERDKKGLPIEYDAHIMDREIVCPKCQTVDQYELTSQASLRLYMHDATPDDIMAALTGGKPKKRPPNPYMSSFRAAAFGRSMHPLAALAQYRKKIAANSNDGMLHLRLGNLLRTLRRQADSLDAFQRAYELEPDNPEICLARGMAEHDYGDRTIAKAMYQQVIRLISPVQMLRQDKMADIAMTAADGLKRLKRKQGSPHQLPIVKEPESSSKPAKRKLFQRRRAKKKRKKRR